ncbi:glycosyltransferase family 4 protein [Candidatus Pacearchaeota archaeon]|nr:glycosyltransferase family 4 protein [Candidatus Pacearchaeota archaeon]
MKKLKIYLQKPWKFSDSPYYQYLRENPAENVMYANIENFKLIQTKKKLKFNNWLKSSIKKVIKNFSPDFPNAHYTKNAKRYDLIHCAHCLSLNKKPFVADIEWVGQFWATGDENKKKRKRILKILMSKHCKKILAWTKWSSEGVLKVFPEVKNKMEIVYPAMPKQKFERKKTKNIHLLFSARRFYFKGGLHATEVIDQLTKKYKHVYGIIASDTPKEVLDKYSKNKKIKFYPLLAKKRLFKEIYPKTDIFVYPSYTDTFGFQLVEALAFGIPVVSVDNLSRNEVVMDKKTGFLVKKPKVWKYDTLVGQEKIVNKICEKTEILIKNNKLRTIMSKNSLKEIETGRFSIKQRNEKLKRIYNDALK